MRKALKNAFGRDKADRKTNRKIEDEAACTAEGAVTLGEAVTPSPQEPDLYSTEGHTGIKVVAQPKDADLDIVFVHGLTGNRETTWTHKNGVFWPEQLAQDINTARIMTFGYDADVVKIFGMAGRNNLRNHGTSLASDVSDRRNGCRERPIIFIAHSLGGLVCEQALLFCGEGGDEFLDSVVRSTRGIIFMGTPHAGADLATWGSIVAKLLGTVRSTNSAILDPLRRKSDVLTAIEQQFQKFLLKLGVNIRIYCFFEEKPVAGVGLIVSQDSATLSQYPNQSIAANHMDMTKFSGRKDAGYQKVLSRVQNNMEVINASTTYLDDSKSHPHNEKRKKCHRTFSGPDYQRYKDRNNYPVKGTCQWFLRHPNYTSWRDSNSSSILWVSADPGCGKSVLSKLLVDKELQATKKRTTCYFFFKDDNDIQKTATSALCALLHQVFAQKPELLGHAVKVSDQNEEDRLKSSVDLLWQVLTTAAEDPRAGEIVCILDALDECRHSELKPLLRKMCRFYDEGSSISRNMALKFLVTSRPLQHIEIEFSNLSQKIPAIRLAGEEHTDEILYETGLVIEYEIEQIQLSFSMHPKTVSILREEFTKVENRTYIWLMLIFDLIREDLQSVINATEREKLFHTIPKSVDAAYTAILNKSKDKIRARKLLKIVCAATRPMSVMEITTALMIQENHETYDDLEIPPNGLSKAYIRNLCGLFVSVIDERVFLLHQTAKEFLMAEEGCTQSALSLPCNEIWKNSITVQNSSLLLASMCMWFLRFEEFKGSFLERDDIDQLISKYEFFEYSATNWAIHFRAAGVPDGDPLVNLAIKFCDVQADRHSSLMLAGQEPGFMLTDFTDQGFYMLVGSTVESDNLHIASILGLEQVVGKLLASPDTDVNAEKYGKTPLWCAARKGYQGIVGQLLAAPGIDVNLADGFMGRTPLWLAAFYECQGIVGQLLAAPGIDVNVKNDSNTTPLWWAACMGYQAIVGQLLSAPGIDVNGAGDRGSTPLWQAAYKGHQEILGQLLAAPGIDVNVANVDSKTPLWWATFRGYQEIVGQLLAAPGIDVNVADGTGSTPLCMAAYTGRQEIVGQLLAAPGIDVNAADVDGDTPLGCAAYEGYQEIVGQLLAVPGIDVNVANKDGKTPLSTAQDRNYEGRGYEGVIKLLESRVLVAPKGLDTYST